MTDTLTPSQICERVGCCKHPCPSVSSDPACCRCEAEAPCEDALAEVAEDKCETCGAELEEDHRERYCASCLHHMEPDPDEAYEFARERRYWDD